MKKGNSFPKDRMKKALKIIRQSSGVKFEVVRDVYHLDPSHIESGASFPTMETYMKYCCAFDHCPGWILLLSCQVDHGQITEAEFFEMISNWETYQHLAEFKVEEFVRMARKEIAG